MKDKLKLIGQKLLFLLKKLGIRVGKDTLLEKGENYYEVLDLGIGKCKFIVATLPNTNIFNRIGHIKIGSKYPNVSKKYFEGKGMDVEIIKIDN